MVTSGMEHTREALMLQDSVLGAKTAGKELPAPDLPPEYQSKAHESQ